MGSYWFLAVASQISVNLHKILLDKVMKYVRRFIPLKNRIMSCLLTHNSAKLSYLTSVDVGSVLNR